jgi:hypothetical protein
MNSPVAWDKNRPVPWQRLIRDWLIYVGIMAVVFLFVYRDDLSAGPFVGLLISGPLFLVVGAVLAKFGYQRKTFRDLRAEGEAKRAVAASATTKPVGTRARPAPTRRTSTGPGTRGRGSSRPGKRR